MQSAQSHAARIVCDCLNTGKVMQSAHAARIVCDGHEYWPGGAECTCRENSV